MQLEGNTLETLPKDFQYRVEQALCKCHTGFHNFLKVVDNILNDDEFQKLIMWATDQGKLVHIKEPDRDDPTAWRMMKAFPADELKQLSQADQLNLGQAFDIAIEVGFSYQGEEYVCRCVRTFARTLTGRIDTCWIGQFIISEDDQTIDLLEDEPPGADIISSF